MFEVKGSGYGVLMESSVRRAVLERGRRAGFVAVSAEVFPDIAVLLFSRSSSMHAHAAEHAGGANTALAPFLVHRDVP